MNATTPASLPFTAAHLRGEYHPASCRYTLPGGLVAVITTERDETMGKPWDEHEGHGPVSEWTDRDKAAGERVLCSDRRSKRYYNVAEAIQIAKRDGWGVNPPLLAALTTKHGRAPTKGEIAAAAVEHDFEHLRGWCADEWEWLIVSVTLENADGKTLGGESCGGIESCENHGFGYYWREVAADYVNALVAEHGRETAERAHWEARDMVTV